MTKYIVVLLNKDEITKKNAHNFARYSAVRRFLKVHSRQHLNGLEALSINNSGTSLMVFLLGDPHVLECGQGS